MQEAIYPQAFPSSSGGGTYQFIVTVKNTGSGIAEVGGLNSETWTLYGTDGSVLQTGDLTAAPEFLAPGATGYLAGWTDFTTDAAYNAAAKVEPSVTFSTVDSLPTNDLKVAHVTVRPDQLGVWLQASGTVSNTGSATVNLGNIAIILLDASGKPVGYLQDGGDVTGLLAGQTKGWSTEAPYVPASAAFKSFKVFAYELTF